MNHRLIIVLWGLALVVVAAIPFAYFARARSVQTVSGVILDVQASSLVYAEQITLRDGNGSLWTFRVDPEVVTNNEEPQSAAHLRQHMAIADPVTVHYRKDRATLVALRIRDGS